MATVDRPSPLDYNDLPSITDVNCTFNADDIIGSGSYAIVFRGTWSGAPVAVKMPHLILADPIRSEHKIVLQAFLTEGRNLLRLRHPYVVQFFGTFDRSSPEGVQIPTLVTELLDCTLERRYNEEPLLNRSQELSFLVHIASGLSYLHLRGVIHRDLKTANVLISKLKTTERAKLADFGQVKSETSTRNTMAPGTPAYMSPEALTEPIEYNKKLDCFSYGVLTLALLTRHEPKPAGSLMISDRKSQTENGLVPNPEVDRRSTDLNKLNLPDEHPLRKMIINCLQNDPSKRPTAKQLYFDVSRLLDNHKSEMSDITVKPADLDSNVDQSEEYHDKIQMLTREVESRKAEIEALKREKAECQCQLSELTEEKSVLYLQGDRHRAAKQSREEQIREQAARNKLLVDTLVEKSKALEQEVCANQAEGRKWAVERSEFQQQAEIAKHYVERATQIAAQRSPTVVTRNKRAWLDRLVKEKWTIGGRIPVDGTRSFHAVKHLGHVFILHVVNNRVSLKHSKDFKQWDEVNVSLPAIRSCQTMISTSNGLLLDCKLARSPRQWCLFLSHDVNGIPVNWEELPNSDHDKSSPASFCLGDRLVLVGGTTGGTTVTEYNIKQKNGMNPDLWNRLPKSRSRMTPIFTRTELHLIGGVNQEGTRVTGSITIDLEDGRPRGEWKKDVIASLLPEQSQAAVIAVNEHIIAVGGKDTSSVSILPLSGGQWTAMQPLVHDREKPRLVCFGQKLLVLGGDNNNSLVKEIEQIDIALCEHPELLPQFETKSFSL